MTTAHVFIASSLDGFIARPSGAIDWLDRKDAAGEDHGYDGFISRMDGIIMGRKTFEVVQGFDPWPYDKPAIVLSQTLTAQDIARHSGGRVKLATSVRDALDITAQLGWTRAYVDGGAAIQAFLREGLVDDIIITRIPVLLGQGVPLFGPLAADVLLQHLQTRAFASGFVQSHYRVMR